MAKIVCRQFKAHLNKNVLSSTCSLELNAGRDHVFSPTPFLTHILKTLYVLGNPARHAVMKLMVSHLFLQ